MLLSFEVSEKSVSAQSAGSINISGLISSNTGLRTRKPGDFRQIA
jgi:hypothetical protein